jgi:tripartite-type tricarboxylate transporter receptor subunit TctC
MTKLPRRGFLHFAAGAAALSAMPRIAMALDYPARPVRIVVGYPAGGAADIAARLAAQWLTARLSQSFIVENRPGAATNIATEEVVGATPDGYTLLLANTTNAINATYYDDLKFDFIRDIAPVAGIIRVPNVMVVNTSFPAKTVAEFIAYAKANPGKINMASGGTGTSTHVAGELFKMMAGVNIVHVPYRGTGPMLVAALADEVQIIADPSTTSLPNIQAGKLRPIAIAGAVRDPQLPDVPTVIEEGFPKLQSPFWLGVVAPAGTPEPIIKKLNSAFREAMNDPTTVKRLDELGAYVKTGTPEDFRKMLASELALWTGVVKAANIQAE